MISAFILPFDKKGKEIEVKGINFLNVDTGSMEISTFNKSYRSLATKASDVFRQLSGMISFQPENKPVQLSLFLDNSSEFIQNLGIFYLEGEVVLPVRFSNSAAFMECCDYLLSGGKGAYYFIINETCCKGHPCEDYLSIHNPFQELGSWITRIAPKGYAQINDSYLKENYLAKFIELDVPVVDVNYDLLAYQWQSLLVKEQLQVMSTVKEDAIFNAFTAETGLEFPIELKILLGIANGVKGFPEGYEFLSAENVLQEWKNWKAIYQSFNFLDLVDDYHYKNSNQKMVPMYVNPYRVPFIHDGGGNFIGIDLLPNKAGKKGQIIAFGVDEIVVRCVAENMNDFLQQLLDGRNPVKKDSPLNGIAIGF